MRKYLCNQCARELGQLPTINTEQSFTGSGIVGDYLFDKYVRHTQFPTGDGFVSIYRDTSYDTYKEYAIISAASGSIEIGDDGKKAMLWWAKEDIGDAIHNQIPVAYNNMVKLVLYENKNKIHHFPTSSLSAHEFKCLKCGGDIVPAE